MKFKATHVEELKSDIQALFAKWEEEKPDAFKAWDRIISVTDMWNIFHHANHLKENGANLSRWYKLGYNDDHIETALRAIMKKLLIIVA